MIERIIEPPKAEKIEKKLEIHGDVRIDNYYWLNERENPKVIGSNSQYKAISGRVIQRNEVSN